MQYFFDSWSTKQLVVSKTLFVSWLRELIPKNLGKMDNNSMLELVLLVFNKNTDLLRLVGTAFDYKLSSVRGLRIKKFIILQIINKQINSIKPEPSFLFVFVDS